MTIKHAFASALFAAFTITAPLTLSASPADAAPRDGGMMRAPHDDERGRGDADMFHDRGRRPPPRAEHRPRQPHGHYRWHAGSWSWKHNQWQWLPGIWIRF